MGKKSAKLTKRNNQLRRCTPNDTCSEFVKHSYEVKEHHQWSPTFHHTLFKEMNGNSSVPWVTPPRYPQAGPSPQLHQAPHSIRWREGHSKCSHRLAAGIYCNVTRWEQSTSNKRYDKIHDVDFCDAIDPPPKHSWIKSEHNISQYGFNKTLIESGDLADRWHYWCQSENIGHQYFNVSSVCLWVRKGCDVTCVIAREDWCHRMST